jgi:hypothetical protein
MWLLKKSLVLQILQAHFNDVCIIMPFNINNFWNFMLLTFLHKWHIANIIAIMSCKIQTDSSLKQISSTFMIGHKEEAITKFIKKPTKYKTQKLVNSTQMYLNPKLNNYNNHNVT